MTWINCHRCSTKYWLPDELYTSAKASEKISFFCPYGHEAHYPAGESREDALQRQLNIARQQIARVEVDANEQRERADKAERQTKRLKKRSAAGTCPCCSRTFSNMAEHMKQRHPNWVKDTGANVVPLKRPAA